MSTEGANRASVFLGFGVCDGGGGDEGVDAEECGFLLTKLIEKTLSSAVFERKSAAQDLLEAFRQTCIAEDDISSLISIIDRLAEDSEYPVRAIVMEQLPQIALFCHKEGPHLDHVLPQHILPHIVKLLTDKFTQVRKTSQAGLLLLVERGIIDPSQVVEHVVPVVMEFTTTTAHEDYRTEITQFMSKLAPLVGKDITIKCYLERFCHLCHDKLFQIRKVCASSIGEMASVVGSNITENVLLSHFRSLCQDEVWGVRKGCAETITVFSSCCEPTIRKGILTDSFVELLKDSSRWVRVSACQSLGPFITTFLSEDSPPATPDCSEAEKTFLASYKSIEFEVFPESDSSDSDEYRKSPKLTSVIPTCGLVAQNTISTSLLEKVSSICEETDQNQNTKVLCSAMETVRDISADFTIIPMEIDDDVNFCEKKLYSTSHNSIPFSFEEKRKKAYEQNGNDPESNENEDTIMCNHKLPVNYNENIVNRVENDQSNILASESCKEQLNENLSLLSSGSSILEQDSTDGLQHKSFAKNPEYETWQYWRDPIPDIDLDTEMLDKTQSRNTENQLVHVVEGDAKMEMDALLEDQNLVAISVNPMAKNENLTEVDIFVEKSKTQYFIPDVHRSCMNLYSATTTRREQAMYGFESLKLGDGFDDDDSDEQLNTTFPFGDEYSAHTLWGSRNCRPRLLTDLPKSIQVDQDIVPGVLLEHFTSLCQQSKDHQNMDSEILSFCVYNFPAVVLTLGPQNWSLVRDCYEALACNVQWKIRYTLASALHEIANILGPELSERDLVPFYNATTKDLDEVRIGVLRNLASFIKMLGGDAQRRCLETLDRFAVTENVRNWRFRLELADQIKKLSEIYETEEIFKHLCPLTMDLLLDRVSEVRKNALNVIPYLVTRLNYCYTDRPNDPTIANDFLDSLVKTLGRSDIWVRRQAFATLAGQLIEIGAMSPPQFAQNILPALIALSKDKVPNVRLKVAQSIVMSIINQEYFAQNDILQQTLLQLQEDEDRDVRYSSQLLQDEFTT